MQLHDLQEQEKQVLFQNTVPNNSNTFSLGLLEAEKCRLKTAGQVSILNTTPGY